jgi:excisionase family DNA binding protein
MDWERMNRIAARWLPQVRVAHPWPQQRFDVNHPRQEPSALAVHAGICAGAARKGGPYRDHYRMQKLLKPTEVADRLSVSRAWVYDAAKFGRIPAIRIGGEEGPLRFVAEDVEDWLVEARSRWTRIAYRRDPRAGHGPAPRPSRRLA